MIPNIANIRLNYGLSGSLPLCSVLIPCKFNLATGLFEPLLTIQEAYPHLGAVHTVSKEAKVKSKEDPRTGRWSMEEDLRLVEHVNKYGKQAWAQISRELNSDFHADRPTRLGKHCRERWFNHLDPDLKSTHHTESDWTESEDELLVSLHHSLGNCWSKIARSIPGRTENHVKNRWNSLMKRAKIDLKKPFASESTVANIVGRMKSEESEDSTEEEGIQKPIAIPAAYSAVKLFTL